MRHAQWPERDGRRGNLEQHGARGRRDPGRPERRLAQPVEVGAHRKEARVVAEAGGGDRIERPERLALDRPRGRAEAEHRGAELVLEEPPRVAELALDAGGVRRVEECVLEPVAGDLVAGGGDRADQAGRAPCRARQHEEGAAPPARGEQVEDAAGRLGDAARWIPGRRRDPAPVVHVEPVLDIDREQRRAPRRERPGGERRARHRATRSRRARRGQTRAAG